MLDTLGQRKGQSSAREGAVAVPTWLPWQHLSVVLAAHSPEALSATSAVPKSCSLMCREVGGLFLPL